MARPFVVAGLKGVVGCLPDAMHLWLGGHDGGFLESHNGGMAP